MPSIAVKDLIFEYPNHRALHGVSFDIEPKSITALVGPNGAGKTTLLRCMAALDFPYSGLVEVAGMDTQEYPRKAHRNIGYLSDFFGLYDDLTVRQSLTFIARTHQIAENKVMGAVTKAAERLEITRYLDKPAGTLSRGLRQRLGIAQAIIHEPMVLLLDEPASGLDPEARLSLSQLFHSLQELGITLVVSSHILAELEDYCTDMLVIREGRVVNHSKGVGGEAAAAEQRYNLEITLTESAALHNDKIEKLEGVSELKLEDNRIICKFAGDEAEQHKLLKKLVKSHPVCGFSVHKERLQDVYMSLADKE